MSLGKMGGFKHALYAAVNYGRKKEMLKAQWCNLCRIRFSSSERLEKNCFKGL